MRSPSMFFTGGLAVVALAACGTSGPQMGQVSVRLSDAPLADIASATVQISKVYLVGGEASGPGFTITDTPQQYDLLDLQGGVTALLGTASIPVGDYEQLRLVVDQATITLAPGLTFSDGSTSMTLKVPSGMQTGIKVNFGGPVHVHPGQTDLVVDFDVSQSFVFLGDQTHPDGVIFKPVLHATATDVAGSISGTSSPASANAALYAIMATANGPDTVATALADPSTGNYTLQFLPPATYTVADSAPGYQTATQMVTVGPGQNVTGVNFTLQASQ